MKSSGLNLKGAVPGLGNAVPSRGVFSQTLKARDPTAGSDRASVCKYGNLGWRKGVQNFPLGSGESRSRKILFQLSVKAGEK